MGWRNCAARRACRLSREKWNEIRQFEEENANLQRENDYRRDRIKKLESSPSEQELEIRKKLKLLRPGETSFILPEQPKPATARRPRPTHHLPTQNRRVMVQRP